MTRKGQPLAQRKTRGLTIRKTLTAIKSLESVRWIIENPPSPQSSRHLNERRHSLYFNTSTLRSADNVRGGHHREENRRRINAHAYARVESVREGRRRIDDGRRRIRTNQSGRQQTPQEMTIQRKKERQKRRERTGKDGEQASFQGGPQREAAYRTPRTGPEEQSHPETAKCGHFEAAILFENQPSCSL